MVATIFVRRINRGSRGDVRNWLEVWHSPTTAPRRSCRGFVPCATSHLDFGILRRALSLMASTGSSTSLVTDSLLPARAGATDRVGLLWLVTVRWTTLAACIGAIVAGESGLDASVPVASGGLVLLVVIASNLWLMWRIRRGHDGATRTAAGVLISADVVLLSWLLLSSGGVMNPVSAFYLVEIVVAALVLGPAWTWVVTTLSVAGYAVLFLAPSDQLQAAQGMHPEIALHMRGMWLAFAGTALVIGVLVTRLAVAVDRRDRALEAMRGRHDKAARVAGLATIVAGAAHELSTPLATIAVVARELERSLANFPHSDERSADARLIRAEIDRCRRVLDDMAGQIAEPMGEAPRPVSVGHVLAEVVDRVAPDARPRVRVAAAPDVSAVWPARVVAQAVANLVRNALQASAVTDYVDVDVVEAGDAIRIVVTDRGTGMPADVLARAGEPFFTTKPQGAGTGLGLFVTRSAIEQLGGTVDLSSIEGQGTVATIRLARDLGVRPRPVQA